jgi:hypothetical protein
MGLKCYPLDKTDLTLKYNANKVSGHVFVC